MLKKDNASSANKNLKLESRHFHEEKPQVYLDLTNKFARIRSSSLPPVHEVESQLSIDMTQTDAANDLSNNINYYI